jgi:two-component system, NtrC family, response regulator GlrR
MIPRGRHPGCSRRNHGLARRAATCCLADNSSRDDTCRDREHRSRRARETTGFPVGASFADFPFRRTMEITTTCGFGDMVGRSAAMRPALARLQRATMCESTVLLLGESGTGKELAAQSIHRLGRRAGGPFVVVDCGAIPAQLIESELFGHERGAFTGAAGPRDGAFQAAHGGTIFLDEIGELPTELQPRLLRALAGRVIKPVGRVDFIDIDVRVVAATNRDLRREVERGRFRDDLYYRLAVIEVRLPPLRERREDIPELVGQILGELGAGPRDRARLEAADSLRRLASRPWPGNIRELRNHLERSVALGAELDIDTRPAAPPAGDGAAIDLARPFRDARAAFERTYLAALLERCAHNIRAAAKAAAIDRAHLYRLLDRHGLR